jgi:Holliday junction resolvasome RuvABC DNA-binding subunit
MEGACSIMADEASILRQFLNGRILSTEAVAALERMGYSANEAKQMVEEWAIVEDQNDVAT